MRINFDTDIVPHRAAGYEWDGEEVRNQEWVSPTVNSTADGALLFSLEDMIAWNEMVRNRTVLERQSWDAMLTPVTLNSGNTYPYGFGWGFDDLNGHPIQAHTGDWQGFQTIYMRIVDADLAIIVLANAAWVSPARLAVAIAAAIDPIYEDPEPPTEPIEDTVPEMTAIVSAKLGKASRSELEPSDFSFLSRASFPRISERLAATLAGRGEPDRLGTARTSAGRGRLAPALPRFVRHG